MFMKLSKNNPVILLVKLQIRLYIRGIFLESKCGAAKIITKLKGVYFHVLPNLICKNHT